jgi:NOL1/NOP2/fmu family ribosome biogenesis protein
MKIKILDKSKKKKFIEKIENFGIEKIKYLLIKTGKERIRAFSGNLSNQEIMALWRLFPIEGIGLYIGKEISDKKTGRQEARLSIEGLHILKNHIKKNIIEIDENEEEEWFRGKDIELKKEQGENIKEFVGVKSEKTKDFIGTGKISRDKKILFNFLPKERRIKN